MSQATGISTMTSEESAQPDEALRTPRSFGQTAYGLATFLSSLATVENRDRAKLAALRRGLGKPGGWDSQLANVVNPRINDVRDDQATICYQVAALFGLHPVGWPRADADGERYPNRTFGRSMHLYAVDKAQNSGGKLEDIKQPLDRRMMALLDANSDEVYDHLRYAVSLLRGTEIPVDWGKLMVDLDRWDDPDRHVQRAWSRAWWPAPEWTKDTAAHTEDSPRSHPALTRE